MGKRERLSSYLRVLTKVSPDLRKQMINDVPLDVMNTLCDCCIKVLIGKVTLTPYQKQRLVRYKTQLCALANNKLSQKQKRWYLTQTESGLFSLIKKLCD